MSISVILPNFNHGKLLWRAVAALMAQSPPPAEVIIINDASTDESLAVIESLGVQFPCIRLINHTQNKGVVVSLNEGLDVATGDLVYFAAADDYSLPGLFAAAEQALARYPEVAFFCGRVVIVDPEGGILGFRPFMQPASRSMMLTPAMVRTKSATSDNWSVGPSVIYRRRRLMEAGGFDAATGAFADGMIVRQLAFESGFYFDTAVLAAWERYPESLSARTALSVTESERLIASALSGVKSRLPADIRETYAERLEQRLRFSMACLRFQFDKGRINAESVGHLLQFKGVARAVLDICARLPFSRTAALTWMTLVVQPYGIGVLLAGWYRAKKANFLEATAVKSAIAEARSRSNELPAKL
jgi:glycosyltransferase involved in cell wall biosynthesis